MTRTGKSGFGAPGPVPAKIDRRQLRCRRDVESADRLQRARADRRGAAQHAPAAAATDRDRRQTGCASRAWSPGRNTGNGDRRAGTAASGERPRCRWRRASSAAPLPRLRHPPGTGRSACSARRRSCRCDSRPRRGRAPPAPAPAPDRPRDQCASTSRWRKSRGTRCRATRTVLGPLRAGDRLRVERVQLPEPELRQFVTDRGHEHQTAAVRRQRKLQSDCNQAATARRAQNVGRPATLRVAQSMVRRFFSSAQAGLLLVIVAWACS